MPATINIDCSGPKKDESKKGSFWRFLVVVLVVVLFFESIFDVPFFNMVTKVICSLCSCSSSSTSAKRNENENENGNRRGRDARGRRVLAAIERVAEKKYEWVSRDPSNSVHVLVPDDGWITFSLRRGRVTMEVHPKYSGLWQSEVRNLKLELRQIGRQLLVRGQQRARTS